MSRDWQEEQVLFHFNGTAVKAKPSFWPMWFSSWPVLIWLAKRRRPERSWKESALVGALAMPVALAADLGHALAHTVSAKAAGAPMDEIHLAADMPRTIYFNNEVSPDQHRIRALGGPIYNAAGFLLSLLWRRLSKPKTVSRELAEISCASQALIGVMSLMPVPIVDGGTILKWTLVADGRPEEVADQQLKQIAVGISLGLFFGTLAIVIGLLLNRPAGRHDG